MKVENMNKGILTPALKERELGVDSDSSSIAYFGSNLKVNKQIY